MRLEFLIRMRRLADLFHWGRRDEVQLKAIDQTNRKGLLRRRKKRKQQQDEQREEEQQARQARQARQEQQAWQARQHEERTEEQSDANDSCVCRTSRVSSQPSSASCSDLEDEVFMGPETFSLVLPATRSLPRDPRRDDQHVHDEQDDSVAARALTVPRRHSKTMHATLPQLPTIIVEGQQGQQQQQQLEGGGGGGCSSWHSRHRSDSRVPVSQTPSSPPPSPTPQRMPEVMFDERAIQAASARQASPYRSPKNAVFTVKYTKVYGEADGAYNNDSKPRGLVFVCNFSKFKNNKYSQRMGSEKDFDNMVNLFTQMGYNPAHRRRRYCMTGSIARKDFLQRLEEFAGEVKHKMLCSCVVILMSHGTGPRTFVTSDNLEVDLLDVYKIFDNINCPNLKGKPKIFILQFCRGQEATAAAAGVASPLQERSRQSSPERRARQQVDNNLLEKMVRKQVSIIMRDYLKHSPKLLDSKGDDKGQLLLQIKEHSRQASLASLTSSIMETDHCEDSDAVDGVCRGGRGGAGGGGAPSGVYEADTSIIPALPAVGFQRYSDMYSIFSTSPGELSHRHPSKGSLLIQAICHVFAEYAYQDEIDTLVRRVSTYMTKTLQRDDPITVPRQTCERTNNGLDKPFYFNPYEMMQNRQFTI